MEVEAEEEGFVAFPAAMAALSATWGATPHEVAAWLYLGPEHDGLIGYVNANELDPPPRFQFPAGAVSSEYLGYLMHCWFEASSLRTFSPRRRYLSGAALLERWAAPEIPSPLDYIRAKVEESRLLDMHPITGMSNIHPGQDGGPLEDALFEEALIEAIEQEDFGFSLRPQSGAETSRERACRIFEKYQAAKKAGKTVFQPQIAEEEGLSISRIKQIVGAERKRRKGNAAG